MNNESKIIENISKINSLLSSSKQNNKYNKSEIKILISQTEKLLKEISDPLKYKEYKNKLQSFKNEYHLINNNDTKDNSNNSYNKIQIATRNTIDMENMTGDILGDLNNQTEKMIGVKTKLNYMDDDLNLSNSLLGNIIGKQNDDMKIIIIEITIYPYCIFFIYIRFIFFIFTIKTFAFINYIKPFKIIYFTF